MEKDSFIKPQIEIVVLQENDVIVTSVTGKYPGIELPDDEW